MKWLKRLLHRCGLLKNRRQQRATILPRSERRTRTKLNGSCTPHEQFTQTLNGIDTRLESSTGEKRLHG